MPKKILYIAPAFPVGGAEKFLVSLANSIVDITEQQTLISLSTNNQLHQELRPEIRFMVMPRKSKFDRIPVRALRRYIQKEKPDIIFCLNFFSYFFLRTATIGLRAHPDVFISYQTTIHQNKKEEWLHKLYFSLLHKGDHILFTSKNQEKYTISRYPLPSRFYSTIINGIDMTRWHLPDQPQQNREIRKKYNLDDGVPVIIMTAAFRPEKNHSGAIRSLKILHEKYNCKARLLFVGEGKLFEETKRYAAEQGMTEFIRFTGPQKDVRPFYWASDVFTLCSTAVETFSFAALEAMACGLPAVLTRIGGADEMIVENLNGFLCEPMDEDIALNWHKAIQTKFSSLAISQFATGHFSLDRMVNDYKTALQLEQLQPVPA